MMAVSEIKVKLYSSFLGVKYGSKYGYTILNAWGLFRYLKVDEVALVELFGLAIYKRCGTVKLLFGWQYAS